MNFRDFYKPGRLTYSFEVFPPKSDAGIADLIANLKNLRDLDPAFVSVTYGAMGSTRDLTRDLATRIKNEVGVTTAFHFTCVGTSRNDIKTTIERFKKEGFELVVALRGDPPQGTEKFIPPSDGFAHANELVSYIRSTNGFSIAVAGYPEGHIEAPNKEIDLENLKRKVDAGGDIVITQLFFDNTDYFDFCERARKIGITVPIVPGIMPISNLKQIEKITKMCGARIPEKLHARLQENEGDPEKIREIGIEHAIAQCRGIMKQCQPWFHFYILNKSEAVRRIINALDADVIARTLSLPKGTKQSS